MKNWVGITRNRNKACVLCNKACELIVERVLWERSAFGNFRNEFINIIV